jgi:hypothetical protein
MQGEGERTHAARECKARSVLTKFKEMEQKVANGEEIDDPLCKYCIDQEQSIDSVFISTRRDKGIDEKIDEWKEFDRNNGANIFGFLSSLPLSPATTAVFGSYLSSLYS